MSGAKYRPSKVGSKGDDVRYYNILFPDKDLKSLRKAAEKLKITGAELVRTAVRKFLEENK